MTDLQRIASEHAARLGIAYPIPQVDLGTNWPQIGREMKYARARRALARALRADPRGLSLPQIALAVGYRGHSGAANACRGIVQPFPAPTGRPIRAKRLTGPLQLRVGGDQSERRRRAILGRLWTDC